MQQPRTNARAGMPRRSAIRPNGYTGSDAARVAMSRAPPFRRGCPRHPMLPASDGAPSSNPFQYAVVAYGGEAVSHPAARPSAERLERALTATAAWFACASVGELADEVCATL